jgi:hypothetical protein
MPRVNYVKDSFVFLLQFQHAQWPYLGDNMDFAT